MRRALILLVTRVGWGQEVGGNREGEGGALMSAATRRAVIPIEAYRCSLENLAFLRIVIREGVGGLAAPGFLLGAGQTRGMGKSSINSR